MAAAMMIASSIICIVFLVDFTKMIFELQNDRNAQRRNSVDGGFNV
ncbi:hypothetical protein [Ensifer soli]